MGIKDWAKSKAPSGKAAFPKRDRSMSPKEEDERDRLAAGRRKLKGLVEHADLASSMADTDDDFDSHDGAAMSHGEVARAAGKLGLVDVAAKHKALMEKHKKAAAAKKGKA